MNFVWELFISKRPIGELINGDLVSGGNRFQGLIYQIFTIFLQLLLSDGKHSTSKTVQHTQRAPIQNYHFASIWLEHVFRNENGSGAKFWTLSSETISLFLRLQSVSSSWLLTARATYHKSRSTWAYPWLCSFSVPFEFPLSSLWVHLDHICELLWFGESWIAATLDLWVINDVQVLEPNSI